MIWCKVLHIVSPSSTSPLPRAGMFPSFLTKTRRIQKPRFSNKKKNGNKQTDSHKFLAVTETASCKSVKRIVSEPAIQIRKIRLKIKVVNIPEPASRQGRDSVSPELLQLQHSLLSPLKSSPCCLFLGPWTFSLTQRPSGKHLGPFLQLQDCLQVSAL